MVVGVCLDEDREKARAALAEMGNPFRSAFNGGFWTGTLARDYGVESIPRCVVVGPDGRILRRQTWLQEVLEDPGEPNR